MTSLGRHGAVPAGAAVLLLLPASLALTGGDGSLQIAILGYALVIVAAYLCPEVGVVFTAMTLLIQLSVHGEALKTGGLDARLLAPPIIGAMVLRAFRARSRPDEVALPAAVGTETSLRFLTAAILPTAAGLSCASLLWTINPAGTANRSGGLIAAAVFCAAVSRTIDIDRLTRVVALIGWSVVAGCIAYWLLFPSVAIHGDRLRGLFVNANGLAACLVVVAPVLLVRLRRLRWPAAMLLAALCEATGSRAGCTALAAELLIFMLAARSAATRVLAFAVTGLASAWLILRSLSTGVGLGSGRGRVRWARSSARCSRLGA
jgi:hypothetical protein